jgi:ABC-type transport system involved in multi-copper enzyme maturation permease subunit
MFKALIKMDIRKHYISMLLWTITLSLLMFLIVILYPMIKDIYNNIPEALLEIMESFGGIPADVLEYYATEAGFLFQVFGAIYAVLLGYNLVSSVEKEKTAEVLYTQPIPRRYFYMSRFVVLVSFIFVFSLINYFVVYIGFLLTADTMNHGSYLLFSFLNFIMLLYMGFIGLFTAHAVSSQTKSMISIVFPIVLYVVYIVAYATNNELLRALRYITPYTFADPVEILKTDFQFEWISFSIYTVLVIGLTFIGYRLFKKRVTIT